MSQDYPSDWSTRRKEIYKRDNYTCQNCRRTRRSNNNLELHAHHIVPKSSGGSHSKSNLTTLCKHCHNSIHNDTTAPREDTAKSDRPTVFQNTDPFEGCPLCGKDCFETFSGGIANAGEVVAKCDYCKTEFSTKRSGVTINGTLEITQSDYDIEGYCLSPVILGKIGKEGIEDIDELDKYVEESDTYTSNLERVFLIIFLIMAVSTVIAVMLGNFLLLVILVLASVSGGFVAVRRLEKQAKH